MDASAGKFEFDANWVRRLRRNLLGWYERNARDLPWRRTSDAYRIWISEIMLQQTTVAAVVPYFERFMARFPSVGDLAAAQEEDVLRLWEGLGYYSRARNIHKTSKRITADHGGTFPPAVAELLKLPGIGRYTAGAIASFAFDAQAPIVEANTLRLYCRLMGFQGDPRSTDGQRLLWDFAKQILPRKQPGCFNQALMELGGTVCAPTSPACDRCPLRSCCATFAQGLQSEIPRPATRAAITQVTEASIAIRDGQRYLLLRRPEGARWAGLWDFPRFETDEINGQSGKRPTKRRATTNSNSPITARQKQQLEQQVLGTTGLHVEVEELLTTIRHSVTRFRITLNCIAARHRSGVLKESADEARWVAPAEFAEYPLSVTGRKLAVLLADRC